MISPKVDPKNVGLVKLVYRLRQSIDLYRIIGMNVEAIKQSAGGPTFWAHVQVLALESVALSVCKIYEHEKHNELNSIPGIIDHLSTVCPAEQKISVDRFLERFGGALGSTDLLEQLRTVFKKFCSDHSVSLQKFRVYRDKVGAHSEHGAALDSLPSVDEFEQMFEFADSFYRLVSGGLLNIGPALVGAHVAVDVVAVLKRLGIVNPKINFEAKSA